MVLSIHIDLQVVEVRDCIFLITVFLAWHNTLAHISADWMHKDIDIEEKSLTNLPQGLSFLAVFIHRFIHSVQHDFPSVSTHTFHKSSVKNDSHFLHPKMVQLITHNNDIYVYTCIPSSFFSKMLFFIFTANYHFPVLKQEIKVQKKKVILGRVSNFR